MKDTNYLPKKLFVRCPWIVVRWSFTNKEVVAESRLNYYCPSGEYHIEVMNIFQDPVFAADNGQQTTDNFTPAVR
jgi:hypothetical protein